MMQKKSLAPKYVVVLCVVALCAAVGGTWRANAQEVPPYLAQQGRLLDALNAPVNGAQELTFNLYTEETGGTAFWTETQTVLLSDGFYSVTLGEGQSLDLAQFSGATLFLGVTVAGEELAPRLALRSVPYAIKSGVAQNVTGDITPTSITIGGANGTVIDASGVSVGGVVVIDGSGEWSGPAPTVSFNDLLDRPFTFNDLSCIDGQIPQVVGGAWTCTPASAADTLSGLACTEGQIPAFVAGVWTCADNIDTTYAPGTGITITGANNTVAVDTGAVQARVGGSCAAGLSIRQINADGTVICEDDTDTNTTYAAGAGITITGANNNIAVDTTAIQGRISGSCAANESIRQINADGTVLCESDSDTTYSAAAGGGLVLGGGNAFGIGADAITSARIADGAVGTLDLADGSVTSAKIADGNVALADLAVNAVDSSKILDGGVGAADLAAASVTTVKIADGAVDTAKILDGGVGAADLAAASVTTAKIADANVTTVKIADANITTAKLADASVTTPKLADLAVNSQKLADGSVVVTKLADTSVTTPKLTDLAVTGVKLADNAVNSVKILDGSIVAADVNRTQVQLRVNGVCPAGQSVRSVNDDGSVNCATDIQSYFYSGSLATASEWEADVIANGNYARFCTQIGKTFENAAEAVGHYNSRASNGYFYDGWYYAGARFCASDTHYAGNGTPTNPYNVWRYNGACGCCIETAEWTFERRAIINCR